MRIAVMLVVAAMLVGAAKVEAGGTPSRHQLPTQLQGHPS